MHSLHCSPIGASQLDSFIERLLQQGVDTQQQRTALMLPSPYLLEQVRQRLKRTELPGWEFPGLFSMDELAEQLAGCRKISRVEQEMILEEILAEFGQDEACACFAGVAGFPGFVAALARLFDEFKMADATPDELDSVMEGVAEAPGGNVTRDAAIAQLFRRYQDKLAEYALVDIAGTYLLAAEALAKPATELPFERLLIAEFSILSPLRLRFVAGLQRRVPVEISIYYEKNQSGLYAATEPVIEALQGMNFVLQQAAASSNASGPLQHLQRHLFAESPPVRQDAAGLKILLSPNRAREVAVVADQVKTALLSGRLQPSDIALVVREPAQYRQLRQSFDERGVPIDAPLTVTIGERACVRLVFHWLELLRGRGALSEATAVIKSPFLRQKWRWDADLVEHRLSAGLLRSWQDWPAAIDRYAPDQATAELWSARLAELREQQTVWTELTRKESVFAAFRAWADWLDLPGALRQCRSQGTLSLAEVRAELLAWQAVLSAVAELEQMFSYLQQGHEPLGPGEFAALLRRMLQGTVIELTGRQEAGVQLVSPGTASGMKFSLVFVLGLTEGEFPAQPRESWLYGDGQRRLFGEMGLELSTAAARGLLEDFYFALAIGMARDELVLSAVADSERLPSRYLNEVTRLFAADAVLVETSGIEQIVANTPAAARSRAEINRAALRHCWQGSGQAAEWQSVYGAILAELPQGLTERARIEANRSAVYAGTVPASLIEQTRFSASALERYAVCPFAFFVTDVLALTGREDADEGVDAMSAGAIWHEILATFMAGRQGQRLEPAELLDYAEQLLALLDRSVQKREQQGRLVPGVWWKYERRRWKRAIRQWLAGELERQRNSLLQPRYFEWAFGMESGPGSDDRSTELPLIVEQDGVRVELQGKVDRIDADATAYRVIDYKSGRIPANKQLQQGVCLQVPVYMMAAETLLGQQFSGGDGLYAPVGQSGRDFLLPGKNDSREELFALTRQHLVQSASGIRAGNFPARPASDCPAYCPAAGFCRQDKDTDSDSAEELQDE